MKNMIKRIIIGVSIGLIIGFINSCEVHAETVGSYQFSSSTYQFGLNTDTLNIPVNNAFNGYGFGLVTFSFGFWNQNPTTGAFNPIRSVAIYVTNGGGAFNCELISNTLQLDSTSNGIPYTIYSASCPANVWSGYAINKIEIKLNYNNANPTSANPNIYLSSFMSFYGGSTAEIVNSINSSNIKSEINTIMQQIYQIDNRIASNFNTLIDYLNSKLDSQIQLQQQQVQQQIDTNNFLKDTSLPDSTSGDITDLNNNIASNGTISSLVTMPITFLQKIISGLNGACSPIIIGELFEYNMTMPCINLQQYIGILWNIIDVICSGFLSYHFGKKLVSIFHKVTSMKDGGLEEAYD